MDPCILIPERETSQLKGTVARRLYTKGLSQHEIAHLLSTSQPMVSKYLSEKNNKEKSLQVQHIAERILEQNRVCFTTLITTQQPSLEKEYFLVTKEQMLTDEKQQIIDTILSAIVLLQQKNCMKIVPEVKMNIAMALPYANSRENVASLPSGLIFVNQELRTYLQPEFGTSKHLATVLLALKKKSSDMLSIMNVKYSPWLFRKIKEKRLRYIILDKKYEIHHSLESSIKPLKHVDVLIHRGSFGIEPMAYFIGHNAIETVKKCCQMLPDIHDKHSS
ncbi:hypothetical protein HYW21_01160 [Candidatus Woesearchaeota archaeon]|nr:hypothetical protein [Candidatus Woesearchaeota archaeon]